MVARDENINNNIRRRSEPRRQDCGEQKVPANGCVWETPNSPAALQTANRLGLPQLHGLGMHREMGNTHSCGVFILFSGSTKEKPLEGSAPAAAAPGSSPRHHGHGIRIQLGVSPSATCPKATQRHPWCSAGAGGLWMGCKETQPCSKDGGFAAALSLPPFLSFSATLPLLFVLRSSSSLSDFCLAFVVHKICLKTQQCSVYSQAGFFSHFTLIISHSKLAAGQGNLKVSSLCVAGAV